jgi:hypothetical protein
MKPNQHALKIGLYLEVNLKEYELYVVSIFYYYLFLGLFIGYLKYKYELMVIV